MQNQSFICEHKPTLRERFFRRLGYKFTLGEEPENIDGMPGWAKTKVRFQFNLADRLRLLTSGSLTVELTHYTDKPFDVMKTRTDYQIMPPSHR